MRAKIKGKIEDRLEGLKIDGVDLEEFFKSFNGLEVEIEIKSKEE